MDERPRLHVTQRAIITEDADGVWTGRYGGEDWCVTAESQEGALERLREKLETLLDDEGRHARIISLGEQTAAGDHTEEGFDARFIGEQAYDDRMIETMQTHFDD
ncbi:hypothetical protein [Gordonia sp. NPDC058843]|uniref:hypothetical protein n=1 Tax=Gordonia sp. NPDC058843 TaxID=3346648 RepID=UPI0036A0FEC7